MKRKLQKKILMGMLSATTLLTNVALGDVVSESHCKTGETVVFSCKMKKGNDILSICGNDYGVRYVYGTKDNIGLELNSDIANMYKRVATKNNVNSYSLHFQNGENYHYFVYQATNQLVSGVRVIIDNKGYKVDHKCANYTTFNTKSLKAISEKE